MVNQRKKEIKTAFTFIELSVTIIVIAILTFVILGGSKSLFSSSSLAKARSLTINSPITKIDGLIAWYETTLPESFISSEAADGLQITEWRDISPASIVMKRNTLKKPSSASAGLVYYKSKGINDIPSLDFATGPSVLQADSLYQGNFDVVTLFIVFRSTATITPDVTTIISDSGPTDPQFRLGIRSNSVNLFDGGTGWAATSTSSNPANISSGTDHIIVAYFNKSASKVLLNNSSGFIGGGLMTFNNQKNLNGFTIGGSYNFASGAFIGLISEVIIYNRPLNIDERKVVMKYLAKKYDIIVTGL